MKISAIENKASASENVTMKAISVMAAKHRNGGM
jgi:hypothetical protein